MLPRSQLLKTRYSFGRLLVTTDPHSKPSSLVEKSFCIAGIYVLVCKTLVGDEISMCLSERDLERFIKDLSSTEVDG